MPIVFTCACGKAFRAKDEWAGLRGICPACKVEFVIGPQPDPPAFTEPPVDWNAAGADPRFSVQAKPRAVPKPPAASKPRGRPFWKDPIVLIGAAVPSAILIAFFAYLAAPRFRAWQEERRQLAEAQKQDAIRKVEEQDRQDRKQLVKDPTKPVAPAKRSIAFSEMPESARLFALINLDLALKMNKEMDHYKVVTHEIKPVPNDPRKIPWLWESKFVVTVVTRSERSGFAPRSYSTTLRSLLHFPRDGNGFDCWREVSELTSGKQFRVHYAESEWLEAFRFLVTKAWVDSFQRFLADADRYGWDEHYRASFLDSRKQELSRKVGISVTELDEILKSAE
jgi:hypothetical protein